MSLASNHHGLKSSIGKIAGYVGLAVFIFGLQIGLLRVFQFAGNKLPKLFDDASSGTWVQFVSARLRMERLYYPKPQTVENVRCTSSAICGDVLTALLATPKGGANDYVEPLQLFRCDLQTGSIDVSAAPAGVRSLLSDGKTVWQLPAYSERIIPFVWEGKPAAVARYSKNRSLRCLITFTAGAWVETDQFVLIPKDFLLTDQPGSPSVEVCPVNDQVVTLLHSPNRVHFRTSLELGSESQANAALKAKQNRSWANFFGRGENRYPGWTQIDLIQVSFKAKDRSGSLLRLAPDIMANHDHPAPRLYWENDQLCMAQSCIALNAGKSGSDLRNGIQWINLEEPETKSYFAYSPIPWERVPSFSTNQVLANSFLGAAGANLATDRGQLHVATAIDGRTFVLNFGRTDGRKIVMRKLNNGEMAFIGQIGCAIDWLCYVDATIAFGLFFMIPMLVLAVAARYVERRRGLALYQAGRETMELASIARRGIARMIDQGMIVAIVVWSIVCHPAAMGWWLFVVEGPDSNRMKSIFKGASWNLVQQSIAAVQDYVVRCLTIPCNCWIIAIALVVIPIQIEAQGRTGRTLGKWITGIRVVRTTVRPCGVARSVLREILALVDGLLFVSWVPGTIAALATQHRQRLGDLMADTVVVVKGTVVGVASNTEPDDVLKNE